MTMYTEQGHCDPSIAMHCSKGPNPALPSLSPARTQTRTHFQCKSGKGRRGLNDSLAGRNRTKSCLSDKQLATLQTVPSAFAQSRPNCKHLSADLRFSRPALLVQAENTLAQWTPIRSEWRWKGSVVKGVVLSVALSCWVLSLLLTVSYWGESNVL